MHKDAMSDLRARAEAAEAEVARLTEMLKSAGEMRDAACRVSEWFCTQARHLEGPRIQALRACMVAYDAHMQPANTAALQEE